MTGMKRWAIGMVGVAAMLGAVGCQDGRDNQIRALQERLDGALADNANLKAQLDSLNRSGGDSASRAIQLQSLLDDANRRMNELQNQLNGCQSELASAKNRPAAPRTEGEWTFAGPYAWTDITEEILFDSGKAQLKSSGKSKLQQVASDLRSKFPGKAYWVIGHTDNDPIRRTADKWQDNLELSQARARVVALELISLGITPKEVIAGGQGEWSPRASNNNAADKAKNRRVTVMAVDRPQRVGSQALVPVKDNSRGQLAAR